MEKDIIKFNGYMIERFLLEKIDDIPKEKKKKLELSCTSFHNKEESNENLYKVSLNVISYTDKTKLDLTIDGIFEISKKIDENTKNVFLNITAPTIIYPYARAFISNVTAFDADETVILPVINFADLKLQN